MKVPAAKKLPSGAWRCQIMVDGTRHSVTAPTKGEAERQAAAIKAGYLDLKKSSGVLTLSDAIDVFIADRASVLSPSTIRGYRIMQRNRFQGLMGRDIHKLTQQELQRAITVESRTASPKTVKNAVALVLAVLKDNGILIQNLKLPQINPKKKRYLQPEDVGRLKEAVAGDSCEVPILLAVWLGLRRSEIMGLCWDCVDEDNSTITVRRAYVPDENNRWVLKETTKNSSSQRTIPCPEYIMDKIRALPHNGEQVFRLNPDTIRKHIVRACKAAGIPETTIHGLRHTNAAIMRSLGVDDAHAMARGGWSSEATYKKTYSYVFDSRADAGDRLIDDYLSNL